MTRSIEIPLHAFSLGATAMTVSEHPATPPSTFVHGGQYDTMYAAVGENCNRYSLVSELWVQIAKQLIADVRILLPIGRKVTQHDSSNRR